MSERFSMRDLAAIKATKSETVQECETKTEVKKKTSKTKNSKYTVKIDADGVKHMILN